MRRLVDVPEHLDGDLADAATLAGNLRDLRRINAWLGGTTLSIEAIRRLVAARRGDGRTGLPIRIVDVGTGGVDIPLALLRTPGPWSAVEVTAVDSRHEVIEAAERLTPGLRGRAGLILEVADGLHLPWPDGTFDVGHASLVLHHFERDAAVPFLRELARVASIGVVINDLARSRTALLGAWLLLHAITRNPWTLHDGVLSVRRAWTRDEALALLDEAGLSALGTANRFAGQRWAIAAVRR